MSSKIGAMRRLSLFAGSSLVAAGLSVGAFTSVSLAPMPAHAANECVPVGVDPSVNGGVPDSYTCPDDTYASGITYDSDGNLTVTTAPANGFTSVSAVGVNLSGAGTDNLSWDSTAGRVSSDADGPVVDITSEAGDIGVATAGVSAQGSGSSSAIRATSTGGGDITITSGRLEGGLGSDAAVVEAITNGGDINVTVIADDGIVGASIGRLRGILAQTSGSGDVSVGVTGTFIMRNAAPDAAIIETTVGAGNTTINIDGLLAVQGFSDFGPVATGTAIRAASASTSPNMAVTVNNNGEIWGSVDFSGVTSGGVTFNNVTGIWRAAGASVFSAGNDTLTFSGPAPANAVGSALAEGSSIDLGAGNDILTITSSFEIGSPIHFGTDLGGSLGLGATLAFGAGTDTINNSGAFSVEGPVLITGLEAFNNSGVVSLGPISSVFVDPDVGDLTSNDVLTMPGATFTGSNLSRIVAAAHFDTNTQEGCDAPTGAGDCLYLPGGVTGGSTLLTLINAGDPATPGAFNPIGVTIIDVSGGTSHASDFILDPNSNGYVVDPRYGGVISRPGLFVYSLRYDEATQRHIVVGLPRSETMEYAMLGSAAQSIWHMTTDTVNNRQTDLRAGSEGDVWVRASGEYSKRDVATGITSLSETFTFDDSYKQYAGTIMGGMDFAHGESDGYSWVLGGQIGYVSSSFDLDASPSSGRLTGGTGGVYGSYWSDRLFIDGTVNSNFLTLDYDAPGLGSKTNTWVRSVGAQLDSGMRFMLTDTVFAEPLATFAFARTTFEELSLRGGEVKPADADSRRAALGLRVGADLLGGPLNVRYYASGRAWHEFAGKYRGIVANPGLDVPLTDDASGSFGEANAGVSIFNDDRTATGFLDAGAKFGDGFSAVDLNLGLRMRW